MVLTHADPLQMISHKKTKHACRRWSVERVCCVCVGSRCEDSPPGGRARYTAGTSSAPAGQGKNCPLEEDHVRVCLCVCAHAPVRRCVDLCCTDGLIILWTTALLVLPSMRRPNKDCIKIKKQSGGGGGGGGARGPVGREAESDVVGLFYLFHFLLII